MFAIEDILTIIDEAEYIRVVDKRFLCVWHGGPIEIFNLEDETSEVIPLYQHGIITIREVCEIIDEYMLDLKDEE